MAVRKLGIFLAILVSSSIGLVTASPASAVEDIPPVTVCVVAGTVNLTPNGQSHLPPELGGPGPQPGVGYNFGEILLLCAGGLTGLCTANSAGNTFGLPTISGFQGNLTVSCTPTGQTCPSSGGQDVGGPSGTLGGPFSLTVGPVIIGSLNDVDCSPIVAANSVAPGVPPHDVGGINDGYGVVALVGVPNPTCTSVVGTNTLNSALPTGISYCGLVVAGGAVIVGANPGCGVYWNVNNPGGAGQTCFPSPGGCGVTWNITIPNGGVNQTCI